MLKPVFNRGFGYWCQLILACLASEDADVRSRAIARIMEIRNTAASKEPLRVRVFELPKACHEHDTHLSYMIDWKRKQVLKPPYLKKFSNKEIRKFESTPLVDRCIRLITENGTRAASSTLRDGLCHSTIGSRQRYPRRETKADFST